MLALHAKGSGFHPQSFKQMKINIANKYINGHRHSQNLRPSARIKHKRWLKGSSPPCLAVDGQVNANSVVSLGVLCLMFCQGGILFVWF